MKKTSDTHRIGFLALLTLIAGASGLVAQEKLPDGAKVTALEVAPAEIVLKGPFSYSQLLVTAVLDSGDRVDATRMAEIKTSADFARLSAGGVIRPQSNGTGQIAVAFAGQAASIPVTVEGVVAGLDASAHRASFVQDIMPALSKLGCNAGTCHGSQAGKNGFKLSLRGYDPLFDHRALTDDLEGRRFNRAAPQSSLMLLKTAGAVPHVGGVLTNPGEPYYELLKDWITDGAQLDLQSPKVQAIEILPAGPIVPLPGMKQQMRVLATFADGVKRDVTLESFVASSNTDVAEVDKFGLVTAARRGESAMLARYEGAYAATTLIVMGDRSGFEWQEQPKRNYIDELVDQKLKRVKVQAAGLCTDVEFVRRVHLDLTGVPPTPEAVKAFLADPTPSQEKRDALIDRLVGSADYVEYWTNKWSDLLQVNRKFLDEKGAWALRGWIRQAIARNTPYDRFVHEVLVASGSTLGNPPAAYYKVLRKPGDAMENSTQLFLAVRFNCNKCHDHPFERWTQDQYYQLAAYFAQVGRKESPEAENRKVGGTNVEQPLPQVEVIYDQAGGEVKHERTGAVTAPKFPYEHKGGVEVTGSRREQLAQWLTSKDNPYFAKSYVNRIWSYLLGAGLIEPVDDIRAGNPPTNPELLDRLTADFIEHGFDVQHLMRVICRSRVYQASIESNQWNEDDSINYSHALARRLPAETLFDSVHRATGSVTKLPGVPVGFRAAQLPDPAVKVDGDFLELLGRPTRESACECERSSGMMLGPILNLVNGAVIAEAISDPANRITKLVAAEADDQKVVQELFFSILCRPPTEKELAAGLEAMKSYKDESEQLQAAVNKFEAETLPARQAAWEETIRQEVQWVTLAPATLDAASGATLVTQPDGSILASGSNTGPELYNVVMKTEQANLTGLRVEALTDDSLPSKGPGRGPNGNFVLSEVRVTAQAGAETTARTVALAAAQADFGQAQFGAAAAIDGNLATGWAIMPEAGKPHVAIFTFQEPLAGGSLTLTVSLDQQYPGKDHNLGRFRLSVTSSPMPIREGIPEPVKQALAVAPEQRDQAQKSVIGDYYRTIDSELASLKAKVAEHNKAGDPRLTAAQDLVWALINSPDFLFNH